MLKATNPAYPRVVKGTRTPTVMYRCWVHIRTRCFNPNTPDWPRYGGRGITMCDRWYESFEAFCEDMGERPDGHSIDRIDNHGNYSPENCRWVVKKEQCRNRRSNKVLEYKGESRSLAEWAETLNLPYDVVKQRINTMGWTVEKAFETPVGNNGGKRSRPQCSSALHTRHL